MPRINKPTFPNIKTADLQKKVDELAAKIDGAKRADGSVDVAKVEDAVRADPALRDAFEEVKDTFQRREMREVWDGCGGGRVTREVNVDPKELDAGEVRSVLSALLDAKARVATQIDKDHDGAVSQDEARYPEGGAGLAGAVAEEVTDDATAAWRGELGAWREAVTGALDKVDGRKRMDARISDVAGKHAQSDLGKEAIAWAYRDVLAAGGSVDTWDLDDKLKDAETSFLRHVPLFSRTVTGEGHLSDREVAGFLGTDDLQAFIADKKAAIEQRVGGDYASFWLEGQDLPNLADKADPDFRRVSSGC